MALRDQPYIPLYVQDFLTDEKLIECSASATGVYIRLICIMHKSEQYGTVLLKQKDKQRGKRLINFAYKLAKQMPYDVGLVISALTELFAERVIHCKGDYLYQKRMVRDNEISIARSEAGRKGGLKTQLASKFAKAKTKAKIQANSENENENTNVVKKNKKGSRKKKDFVPPTLEEWKAYFKEKGYCESVAITSWTGYNEADWHDSEGKPVLNWKQKANNVWFKDKNKIKQIQQPIIQPTTYTQKINQDKENMAGAILEAKYGKGYTGADTRDIGGT